MINTRAPDGANKNDYAILESKVQHQTLFTLRSNVNLESPVDFFAAENKFCEDTCNGRLLILPP